MTTYIANAFSLGMVPTANLPDVRFSPCNRPQDTESMVSCVGHPDTAAVLGVENNRIDVTLKPGDVMYVAQLQGGRLPAGSTTLPEGFSFQWVKVSL